MDDVTREAIKECLDSAGLNLRSTHPTLCLPIINRLYKKMTMGIRFSEIKVADDMIIDGHHRYLASLLAKVELERIPSRATSAITITAWSDVVFSDEDWDTEAKIKMLNELDAVYNDVPLDEILRVL